MKIQSCYSQNQIGMYWETSESSRIKLTPLLIPRDGQDLKFSWAQDATKS